MSMIPQPKTILIGRASPLFPGMKTL